MASGQRFPWTRTRFLTLRHRDAKGGVAVSEVLSVNRENSWREIRKANAVAFLPYGEYFRDFGRWYLLENKWSGREDLNPRPPGPEPDSSVEYWLRPRPVAAGLHRFGASRSRVRALNKIDPCHCSSPERV